MADRNPEIVAFLKKLFIGTDTMGELAAYMHMHEASPEETAAHFFKAYRPIWTKCVSGVTLERVSASLPE